MATLPTSISGSARGITNTLEGYILRNETIGDEDISQQTPDQNGAIADDTTYDTHFTLSLVAISATEARTKPCESGEFISYGGKKYKVKKCEQAGTYNDHLRWTITAEAWTNYPTGA